MGKKLHVGNLPFSVDDSVLQARFAEIGTVVSAKVLIDRDSGRSRGYGFVEMETDEDAAKAIEQLNGADMGGRPLKVSEARPPEPRGEGGGRGGFGGRGGGGFGGRGGGGRGGRGDRGGY